MITRRSMLLGLTASLIAAPAVIRTPGLLMPIRKLIEPDDPWLVRWGPSTEFIFRTSIPEGKWRDMYAAADWPSRTIKAPPSGFKIARA